MPEVAIQSIQIGAEHASDMALEFLNSGVEKSTPLEAPTKDFAPYMQTKETKNNIAVLTPFELVAQKQNQIESLQSQSLDEFYDRWSTAEDELMDDLILSSELLNKKFFQASELVAQAAELDPSGRTTLSDLGSDGRRVEGSAQQIAAELKSDKLNESDSNSIFQQFLYLISDSQEKINSVIADIGHKAKSEISMQAMIEMQQKFNFIQMQIDLFSSGMSKILENIKTLMNVQS